MHTLMVILLKELLGPVKEPHCSSLTSFVWCSDSLLTPQEIGVWGGETRASMFLGFPESLACCQLGALDKAEVSSCFNFNMLGIEGLFCVWL